MKLFNDKNTDERIELQRLKLFREVYLFFTFGLFISTLIKIFVYNLDSSACITETILMPGGAIYMMVRSYMLGEKVQANVKKSSFILLPLIYACLSTGFALMGMHMRGELTYDIKSSLLTLALIFISTFALGFAIAFFSYKLYNKRNKKLEKKYSDD